jgi:hypothetical protein
MLSGLGSVRIDPDSVVALEREAGKATTIALASGHSFNVAGHIDEVEKKLGFSSGENSAQKWENE